MLQLDGYVRVSRVGYRGGERFISPTVQRDQIQAWATMRGARLLEVWEELDESGGRSDRPLLETAVRRVEQGLSDGLVVAKVDRFGRSLIDGLLTIQRIEGAGGTFFSVLDGLDLGTPTGRLVLRIMLSMAEWDLDRIRGQWEIAKARAVARGAHVGSTVPVGYRKTRAGRLRLDPKVAPVLEEAFRMRAGGEPILAVCRFLADHEVTTGKGNRSWSQTTATQVLSSEVYLGVLNHGRHRNEHAHPALVDAATWHGAQRPRRPTPIRCASTALLKGIVRCAGCGMTMSPSRRIMGGREVHYFLCRHYSAGGTCPAPANISSARLDPCVELIALDLLRRRRRPPIEELRRAEQRAVDAQQALARYRDSERVRNTLGERAFSDGLAARVDRLRAAQHALGSAQIRLAAHDLPKYAETKRRWPEMSVDERREIVRRVIDVVFVKPDHRIPVSERVMVCPAGTAPARLPRPGDKRSKLRAYELRPRWVTPRP